MANELTLADISTYAAQLLSQGATVKSFTGAAADGTSTDVEADSPGTGKRWLIMKIVADVDTAAETLLIEDEDGTDLLTLRFPVSDVYIFNNLNLEVTALKGFKFDKGTTAAIRGWVVYKPIKSGDFVMGY